ncbi:hypothetical protein Poli38472_004011 [Pythium oligandrum]|uniref:Calcineurin-like phosphoesterase domain-containing protein n=1 Tax=Pythium oligandrum TaxID=41045 RepID=A0A8K1CMA3_PYTOL|nr:hypothetical protein Poli38472_004011 [Pythium oligandrum]|eukprot:TMW66246.1 hypothetical protein Poli38472_004011 [Pythium oligandrum]
MHLEAGVKKDDDNKTLHRPQGNALHSNYYERWLKAIGFSLLAFWFVFVIVYWNISSDEPASAGRADVALDIPSRTNAVASGTFENAFPEETNFMVIGDYGTGSEDQVRVAQTLKMFAAAMEPKPSFVLSTGDQIYEHGIASADDPMLKPRFEKMYEHPDLRVPWYITIGNHDCEGSIDAMLEYARQKDSLWYMPRRYYKIDRPVAPKTILRMIVVDACDLVCGHEPRNVRCKDSMNKQSSEKTRVEQYQWIEEVLSAGMPAGIERMWTIVVGHWAVYSYAGNADTPELIRSLDPLLQKYKVHAYFNGHDHCMQHIKKVENGWTRNYFVSGAGGYKVHDLKPHARANPDLVHAAMVHGFMTVRMTKDLFRVQLVDKMGDILYAADVDYEAPWDKTQ